jgi:sugar phosphate isomerase/epimerase
MKRISIGTWAYSIGPYADNPVPFDEVIDKVAALGFDGLELGGFPPHPNPDDLKGKTERRELTEKLREKGLEWSGLAANLWHTKLLNTADNTGYLDEFRKNLEFCVDLGIDMIRVDTVQPPTVFEEVNKGTARGRLEHTWFTCAEEAAKAGVRIVWEFEPGFAFNKPSDIVRIHDAVNKPNFGLQYDTCHGQMVGVNGARQEGEKETFRDQIAFIRMLAGRINHIHLIDSDGTLHDDETSTHAPIGEGVLNFDALLTELEQSGVPHNWWTIDLCFWPDAWEVTEKCKRAVDALNEKYG